MHREKLPALPAPYFAVEYSIFTPCFSPVWRSSPQVTSVPLRSLLKCSRDKQSARDAARIRTCPTPRRSARVQARSFGSIPPEMVAFATSPGISFWLKEAITLPDASLTPSTSVRNASISAPQATAQAEDISSALTLWYSPSSPKATDASTGTPPCCQIASSHRTLTALISPTKPRSRPSTFL